VKRRLAIVAPHADVGEGALRALAIALAPHLREVLRAEARGTELVDVLLEVPGPKRAVMRACRSRLVRGFGLDEATAFALLSVWNRTCQPPWSAWELARKVTQAATAGQMTVGALLDEGRVA
jgi:hypothetical protein